MTFKQLEQFLRTEKWRAGTKHNTQMCGKYARCAYCDRFSDYPCARAYDSLMQRKREGKPVVSSWQFPEPDVKAKFGTDFASEDTERGVMRVSIDPEDLFYFSLGGRNVEMYTQPYYGRDSENFYPQTIYASLPYGTEESEEDAVNNRGTRVLVIRKRAETKRY